MREEERTRTRSQSPRNRSIERPRGYLIYKIVHQKYFVLAPSSQVHSLSLFLSRNQMPGHPQLQRQDVWNGTQGDHQGRVDLEYCQHAVASCFDELTPHILLRVIARLDMVKLARLRECRVVPVQLAQPSEIQVIGLGRRQVTFQNSTHRWIAGYPSRIVRRLHLKCPTYAGSKRICESKYSHQPITEGGTIAAIRTIVTKSRTSASVS